MVSYAKNLGLTSNKNYFTHVMKFGTMAEEHAEKKCRDIGICL